MKATSFIACIAILFALSLTSCNKDDSPEVITKAKLSGYIQKGPFLNGTSITVAELNQDLSQTGKSFTSQIKDNEGTFELANLQLSSPYLQLKADGFYFNEVSGETSKSQITLFALADVSNISTLNVNVLSTLEKGRVEKLVADGLSFTEAKKKAMEEILAIFSLTKTDMQSSEMLDINQPGDDNAILLAISVVLQGYRSEAELSELLANMSADISPDGKLDSEALGTALISHAKYLNTVQIRANLVKRYNEIGATLQIPEFEKYMAQFIEKSSYKAVSLITYPETVEGKLNLLNETNLIFPSGLGGPPPSVDPYSFLSAVTLKGMSLKIKLEYVAGGNPTMGYWYYRVEDGTNWIASQYDMSKNSQVFTIIESGKPGNLKLLFPEGNGVKIRIFYFENNDLVATKSRIVTIN
ncbi:MAG TPA: hypothetical protein VGK10_01720 [Prolixibacteraceae bacterium]|jgi:hypothetical protein